MSNFGWIPDLPDSKDKFYADVRQIVASNILPSSDMRFLLSPVEDQGSMSSCVANAAVGGLEYLQRKAGYKKAIDMSRMFIYFNARRMDNLQNQDRGCMIRSMIKSLTTDGVCPENRWKYLSKNLFKTPRKLIYWISAKRVILDYYRILQTDIENYKAAISEGYPVIFGTLLFESFARVSLDGKVSVPDISKEKLLGRHAMLMVGYNQDGIIVRNSWGIYWGDMGYCYFPYEYFTKYPSFSGDAWCIRTQKKLR